MNDSKCATEHEDAESVTEQPHRTLDMEKVEDSHRLGASMSTATTRMLRRHFVMKTSRFGKVSKVAAGLPKFTARTSAGCPAIHCDTSTVS